MQGDHAKCPGPTQFAGRTADTLNATLALEGAARSTSNVVSTSGAPAEAGTPTVVSHAVAEL
jgi:hypothetical protein